MSIITIVAVDAEWGIGFNGQLLEQIPEDMKFFKETTLEHTVIMGKKTFESIPGFGLSHRTNIIITHGKKELYTGLHTTVFDSFERVLNNIILPNKDKEDFYIIGGASIYKQLLPYCDKAYITHIYKTHENVDAYFPNLDINPDWEPIEESEIKNYNGIQFQFVTYCKIN